MLNNATWPIGSLAILLAAAGASAQDSPLSMPRPSNTVHYSFSNPGARSLGMGGAFVALADDATAAFSNPSGLVQLTKPEVSIEGRYWSYTTPYTAGGRVSGEPIGLPIDTVDGLIRSESNEDLSGISFLSFVYPKNKWSLAFYRHQLVNFRASTEVNGLFGELDLLGFTFDRLPDQRTVMDLDIVSYGLAGAYKVTGNLFLGFGVSYHEGNSTSSVVAYKYCDPLLICLFNQNNVLDPNDFDPQDVIYQAAFAAHDSDWGFNAGFLWRFLPRWVWGGTYRRGPEFDFETETRSGPGLEDIGVAEGTLVPDVSGSGSLRFPQMFGLGIAFSPSDALRISAEWDRVEYSSVMDATVRLLTGEEVHPFEIEQIVIDDGDEFRLGFEYTFINLNPILSARFGAWLDPDHRVRHVGDSPISSAFFQGGDDEMHYSGGIGFKFKRFQMDLGADVSNPVDTVALSALYQF